MSLNLSPIFELPRELIIKILEYTGNSEIHYERAIDCDIMYPELSDATNLWATCKYFDYLKELYYMVFHETEYEYIYTTVKLIGKNKENGPQYRFMSGHYAESNHLTGYSYLVDDKHQGCHAYATMLRSNFGINIVNNLAYELDDDTMLIIMKQIHQQWKDVDPISKKYICDFNNIHTECIYRIKTMLIRETIPPNSYTFILPEMEREPNYDKYAQM
jgi:hypothetical protein